jgi:serine/threonine protein kinase
MKEPLPDSATLSHYRILSRLGAGGMGEVYLAEDTQLDRKVAIKFLPPQSIADEQAKKRARP